MPHIELQLISKVAATVDHNIDVDDDREVDHNKTLILEVHDDADVHNAGSGNDVAAGHQRPGVAPMPWLGTNARWATMP